jgi:hypothetical protein
MDVPLQPFDAQAHFRSRDITLQLSPPPSTATTVTPIEENKEKKLQELYEYCRLDDVDIEPEDYIMNRLTPAEMSKFDRDGYIIVVRCKV